MIKRRKSFISFLIAGVFSFGIFSNIIVVKAVPNEEVGINTINPKPQQIEAVGDGFELGETVTLIGSDLANEQAVSELKALLQEHNIAFEESATPSSQNTNIYIGEPEDGDIIKNKLQEMGVEEVEALENEGYVLATKEDESSKDVVLAGKDDRGSYYAVQTLEQLLVKVGEVIKLPEVEVRDYPAMELRGSIEGFYGAPWSHSDRLEQLDFYGETKMNTYIYAPKDDPYHRDKWDEPYPESEMVRMQELIDKSAENEVDFVFAISPGNTIDLYSESDYEALIVKLDQMYDMGVRSFAVFFDDIANKDATGQANLLNRVQREFIEVKEGCKPLIMVPQEYTLGWVGSYTTTMARTLDEDIIVMWTGNDVVPATITQNDIQRAKQHYNRNKLFIWWNYPVNDYCQDKLLMGPTEGLDLNLDDEIAGIVSNPMNESEASKPTLYTVSDYSWNTKNYNQEESWDNALKYVGGEAYEGLKTFTEHSKSSVINGYKESTEIKPLVDDLLRKWQLGEDVTQLLETIKGEFEYIEAAEKDIRDNINNEALIGDIDAYLEKLALYGVMGQDVIDMIDAQLDGDMNEVWKKKLEISKNLKVADDMRVIKWTTPVKVTIGSKVLDPFIRDSIRISDKLFEASLSGEKEQLITANTSLSTYQNYRVENMVDGDMDSKYWSAEAVEAGDYIGIDLGEVTKVKDIFLQMAKTGGDIISRGQLEYSVDGESWTAIGGETTDRLVTVDGLAIEARYIRYRALENTAYWLQVHEFAVNLSDKVEKESIYSNASGIDSLEAVKADGKYSINSNNSILNLSAGDYIGLKLPQYSRFDAFDLSLQGEVVGRVEVSMNAREWETVTEVNGNSANIEIPYGARYIRLVVEENASGIKIDNFDATLETKRTLTASTNMPTYSNNTINKMVDGDENTFFWSSRGVKANDYVMVDLGKLTNVRDITLQMAHQSHASDYMEYGQMEYSADGQEWHRIGAETSDKTVVKRGLDIDARYLRYRAVKDSHNWATFVEFKINTEAASNSAITGGPEGAVGFDLNQMIDKNLLTAYKPEAKPTAGQEVIYKSSSDKALTAIHIFQDPDSICNAEIFVNDKNNNWVSVGALDTAYKLLEVNPELQASDIKLVWNEEGALPIIHEIMPQYTENSGGGEDIIVGKPSNLTAVKGSTEVTLNWEAPETTVGLKEYIIYKDGKEIAKVPASNTEFTATDLRANTIYGFKVVSKYSNDETSKPVSINIRTKK